MTALQLLLQHEALVKEYGAHVPYFTLPLGVLESEAERSRRAEGAAATALGGSVLHHSEPPSSASCPPPVLFPPEPKCWLCVSSDDETEICPRHQLRLDEIADYAKRAATASCVNCSTIADLDGDARCIACAVPAYHDRDDS